MRHVTETRPRVEVAVSVGPWETITITVTGEGSALAEVATPKVTHTAQTRVIVVVGTVVVVADGTRWAVVVTRTTRNARGTCPVGNGTRTHRHTRRWWESVFAQEDACQKQEDGETKEAHACSQTSN